MDSKDPLVAGQKGYFRSRIGVERVKLLSRRFLGFECSIHTQTSHVEFGLGGGGDLGFRHDL